MNGSSTVCISAPNRSVQFGKITNRTEFDLTWTDELKNYLIIQWSDFNKKFLFVALVMYFKIKKKIFKIGLVDREIFAKYYFLLYPKGIGLNPWNLQRTWVLWPAIYGRCFFIFFVIIVFGNNTNLRFPFYFFKNKP